ncbi:MAG: RluA family pseudouridine synthase [Clostridia bacterium]
MPIYRLEITAALAGFTVRHAALYALRLSNGQFKRAKFHGSVLLNGMPALANARLAAGQLLELTVPEGEHSLPAPMSLSLRVPYEDDAFLIVDKPAPLPSASSAKQAAPTLENAVFAHLGCPEPFVYRPVNRLDKGTSGLMLVANTAHAQALLQRQLHSDAFIREYLAVVEGAPPQAEGLIDLPIAKEDGATIRRVIDATGKEARTHYWLLASQHGRSLVRLRLDTGRTHQIRVHLRALGCPVVGDFLYGAEDAALPGRFALHSALVAVRHPFTGALIVRESALPPELQALMT